MCAKFTLVRAYMHDQETVHKMVTENIYCLIKDNRKFKKNLFSLNIRRLYMRLFALSPTIRRLFADYSPTIRRLFADYSTTIRRLFSFYQLPRERVSLSFFLCKVLYQLITMSNTLDGNPSHCSVLLAFQRHFADL
jgi:hypothetical protein